MIYDTKFYDTIISLDGTLFKTHKYILCKTKSSFFLNLYKKNLVQSLEEPILLEIFYPITKKIFQLVLTVLYKEQVEWKQVLSNLDNTQLLELYKSCHLLDIYIKPFDKQTYSFQSKQIKYIRKCIENFEKDIINYIDFYNPCLSEINKRIKNSEISIDLLYNFLKNNNSIKYNFDLLTIIQGIVNQSNMAFDNEYDKKRYIQKLFRERVYYSNSGIPIENIHINYIGKLLESH